MQVNAMQCNAVYKLGCCKLMTAVAAGGQSMRVLVTVETGCRQLDTKLLTHQYYLPQK